MDLQAYSAGSCVLVLLTQVLLVKHWGLLPAFLVYLLSFGYLITEDEGVITFPVSFIIIPATEF